MFSGKEDTMRFSLLNTYADYLNDIIELEHLANEFSEVEVGREIAEQLRKIAKVIYLRINGKSEIEEKIEEIFDGFWA